MRGAALRSGSAEEVAERDERLRQRIETWLSKVDSDRYQAVKMAYWKHPPTVGPIADHIKRFLALPPYEQFRISRDYGFLARKAPKDVTEQGGPV